MQQFRRLLAAEAVQSAALALEGIDDVHGGDGLAASVLGVGHGIADDVLEEDLEDTAGLFIDEARDALHSTSASQTADSRLGARAASISNAMSMNKVMMSSVCVCVCVYV